MYEVSGIHVLVIGVNCGVYHGSIYIVIVKDVCFISITQIICINTKVKRLNE